MRLVKDLPIEGRIVNTEGKPVQGASLNVVSLSASTNGRIDDYLTAWKRDWRKASLPKYLPSPETILPPVRTDKAGRFRITGLGGERVIGLELHGPGIVKATLHIVGRSGFDPAPVNRAAREQTLPWPSSSQPPPFHGPKFDFVAATARAIEGTLRESGGGKPLEGVKVFASGKVISGYLNSSETITDKNGRFRLGSLYREKEYTLTAVPGERDPYLRSWLRVRDVRIGSQPLRVDMVMSRGVVVTGRAIDKTTGKGVRSHICFVPLPGNPFADKPGYDSYRYEQQAGTLCGDDGRFRVVVLPGPGVLSAQAQFLEKANGGAMICPYKEAEFEAVDRKKIKVLFNDDFGRYFNGAGGMVCVLSLRHAVKRLDLAPDSDEVKCDLVLDRGRTLTLAIQDDEGKPLAGATVACVSGGMASDFADASGTIFALDPKQPRRLVILHFKKQLAGVLTVRGDETAPVTARLVRTGSAIGRLLNVDGQPIAGADIGLVFKDHTAGQLYFQLDHHRPRIRTGKDGRFHVESIVAGMRFDLNFRRGRKLLDVQPDIGWRTIASGETLDLGDLRAKPGG